MIITYEKIHPDAKTPTKAHDMDACWDLSSIEDKTIPPFTSVAIRTGLRFDIPNGNQIHVYSRSGLAVHHQVFVANAPGVIDAGYTGELAVILYNGANKVFEITKGMKVAQFCRQLVYEDNLREGVVDTNTERGEKGFGSSGL